MKVPRWIAKAVEIPYAKLYRLSYALAVMFVLVGGWTLGTATTDHDSTTAVSRYTLAFAYFVLAAVAAVEAGKMKNASRREDAITFELLMVAQSWLTGSHIVDESLRQGDIELAQGAVRHLSMTCTAFLLAHSDGEIRVGSEPPA